MFSWRSGRGLRAFPIFTFVCWIIGFATPVSAANRNWDPTLSNSPFIGGAGNWNVSTTANWYDGVSDVQWTDTTGTVDTAIFGGQQGGTVTIASNPIGALGVQFSTPGYTLGGTALTLGTGGVAVNNIVAGNTTIGAPFNLTGDQPWSVARASNLIVNGAISGANAITKSGPGTLTINANNSALTGALTVSGGRLNLGHMNALGTGASALTFGANTSFDNTSGAAFTLPGNHPISLGGTVAFAGSNDVNLGTGTVSGGGGRTLVVRRNNLTIGGQIDLLAGGRNFTKQGAGTLHLTSAAQNYDQTLIQGGVIDLGTTGQLGAGFGGGVPQQFTLTNGEFRISGSSSGNRSESVGALSILSGRDALSLSAHAATNTTFTAASIGARAIYAAPLFRGSNLGTTPFSTPAAGASNIVFTTPPTADPIVAAATTYGALGADTAGTPTKAVFRGALYAASPTGNGTSFATYDADNGVRALNAASEQSTTYPLVNSSDNVRLDLAADTAITGVGTNTLQLNNVSGSLKTVTNTGTLLAPANGLLFTGNSPVTLTGGSATFAFGAAAGDAVIMSTNTAGVTIASTLAATGTVERGWTFAGPGDITLTGPITGTGGNGGIAVMGPGTVTLDAAMAISSKGLMVQGGTAKLGANFSWNQLRSFKVADGAVLDVNGKSMPTNLEGLSSNDIAGSGSGAGGTIINSSITPVTLTFAPASGNRSSGAVVTGDISLVMAMPNTATATSTQTLTGQSTYTGTTTITSGTITLGINNALPATTPLAVNGVDTPFTVGGVLNLNGFSQSVGSLAGSAGTILGNIQNNSATNASALNVSGATDTTFSGVLGGGAGVLALAKSGTSKLTLGGANTYTGGTVVNGGTLAVINTTGSGTGTGPVTVNPGGTLGGNGLITTTNENVVVLAGGGLAPTASATPLTFDLGSGTLNAAGVNVGGFKFGIDTTTTSSQVKVNGSTALNLGTLNFSDFTFTNLGGVTANTDYILFDAPSSFTATLGTASGVFGGFNAMLALDNTTNFDVILKVGTAAANPGDFNNDGKVDAADYVVWRETINTQVKYDEWKSNFGKTYSGSSAGSVDGNVAVPEPASCALVLLMSSLVAMGWRRR